MKIKLSYKRKTRKNDYKKYFIDGGYNLYWVYTNFDKITNIRQRINIDDDTINEFEIQELPDNVFKELKNQFPLIEYKI